VGMEFQFDHVLHISYSGFAENFLDRNAWEAFNPPKRHPRRRHDYAGRHVPGRDKEQELARIASSVRPFHDPQN
jgi:hypothetical protein